MRWDRRIVVVWLAIAAWIMAPAAGQAQSNALPVTPGAGKYLPAAADVGPGWVDVWRGGIAPGADLFREGVKAVYGGPEGARALVFVWLTQDGATTSRRAWASTTQLFDSYRDPFAGAADSSAASRLAGLPAPAGCAEASRAEGLDARLLFPGGLTLCAVDPDVIILAIASGTVAGKQGHAASDALVELALDHAGMATPTS